MQNGYNRPITLHSPGQAGFPWLEVGVVGKEGFFPSIVQGTHTRHIETSPSNSLVEDSHGREKLSTLSIPWVEELGHETHCAES